MSFIARKFPDANRISMFGHSSGAHKCAMIVSISHTDTVLNDYLKRKLCTVAIICGVFDVIHLLNTSINDAVKMNM